MENIDQQIAETLRVAGVQLNEANGHLNYELDINIYYNETGAYGTPASATLYSEEEGPWNICKNTIFNSDEDLEEYIINQCVEKARTYAPNVPLKVNVKQHFRGGKTKEYSTTTKLNESNEDAGIKENPYRLEDDLASQFKGTAWNPELDEDTTSTEDKVDWSVRDGVDKIAKEKQLSTHDAMIEYSDKHNMNFGDVYDEYMHGKEDLSLEEAKKRLESVKKDFINAQYSDDFLYSNGGWDSYEREIRHLERLVKKLENKEPINESYESELRTNSNIDSELAHQPWAKNPPEVNNQEWTLVSYKDFDIIVSHYNEGPYDNEDDERFEVTIYPKGQADDREPGIDYENSQSWIKCLEKIAEVDRKYHAGDYNKDEPEEDGSEYDSDYTKVDPEATKELSERMNKWVAKTPLEQAIKYVNDGMKAKYGREYPEEEDESDYRRKLCSAAAKKFNISLDKIIDKIASDYVDSMPYVIQDKQGNYSEI